MCIQYNQERSMHITGQVKEYVVCKLHNKMEVTIWVGAVVEIHSLKYDNSEGIIFDWYPVVFDKCTVCILSPSDTYCRFPFPGFIHITEAKMFTHGGGFVYS